MKKLFYLSALICFIALPGLSMAQETTTMDEIVVTANRVQEAKREITSNVTIINEEEIQNSSAKDLGELLTEKAIGHSHQYPGSLNGIGIRGFRSSVFGNVLEGDVLVLVNGRRSVTANIAKINAKNIERVEIIRGPAAVQYGTTAMGGVINVITKQGEDKPTFFVEGTLGSFGYNAKSVGAAGKFKNFNFSGSFTTESKDDYDTANGDKYNNTGYEQKDSLSLNFGYEFSPNNRIGLLYSCSDGDHIGSAGYLSQNDLDDYKEFRSETMDFNYNGKTKDEHFSWQARYFVSTDEETYVDPTTSNPDFFDNGIPSEKKTKQKGAQAQVSYDQKYFLLTAGVDWINLKTEDDTYSPKDTEYDNPAGFLLAKTRLLDKKLIVTGGMRHDKYEVDMKDEGKEESDNCTSPQLGMAYLFTDNFKLRTNYGKAFKMPSAQQLAADFTSWGTNYVGNPDLDPEKSGTYEIGIDFSKASFDSSLTIFHTDFKDKIVSYTKAAFVKSWKNLGKAEIEGIEATLSYDLGDLFSWDYQVKPYIDLTYLNEYKDKETGQDLLYTSDLQVSYGIAISDFEGFSTNLVFCYTGEQKIEDFEGGAFPAPIIKHRSFTTANLTISKRIFKSPKYGNVTLRGEIQNLFDKDCEYVQGYPIPGRSFFMSLRYDF
jgi:vitamin B12 transporter